MKGGAKMTVDVAKKIDFEYDSGAQSDTAENFSDGPLAVASFQPYKPSSPPQHTTSFIFPLPPSTYKLHDYT